MTRPSRFAVTDRLFREAVRHGPVLEIGCGDGRVLEMLRLVGHTVVGLDIDPAALQGARQRGLRALVCGDGEVLPFADESFGAVVSGYFSANLMDRDRMLSEVARVLRPGGTVAYTLLNPLARAVDDTQVRARRLKLPRPRRMAALMRRLGSPSAEAERLRNAGLVPEVLVGPAYAPVLRRLAPGLIPRLYGKATLLAWEVVVSGYKPENRFK